VKTQFVAEKKKPSIIIEETSETLEEPAKIVAKENTVEKEVPIVEQKEAKEVVSERNIEVEESAPVVAP
jgi:hypothetical protein